MLQPRKWHKTITGLDKTAVFHYSQLGSRPFCGFSLDSMTLRKYGPWSVLALGSWMKLSSFQALCFKYEISKWPRKIFSELLSRFYDSNTETSDKTSTSTLSISFQVFCLANLRSKGPPPPLLPQDLTFVGTTIVRQDRIGTFSEEIDDFLLPFCLSLVLLNLKPVHR